MSRILDEVTGRFPSLAIRAHGCSDLRLMGELASHAVDSYGAGDIQGVSDAFKLTELVLCSPLLEERDAGVLGFLETVQNIASHRADGLAVFEPFLGPKSRDAWNELITVWQGKSSLAEVVAAETGARLGPRWWDFGKKRRTNSPSDLLKNVQDPELRRIIEQITRE